MKVIFRKEESVIGEVVVPFIVLSQLMKIAFSEFSYEELGKREFIISREGENIHLRSRPIKP